jgi:hypothetical protein
MSQMAPIKGQNGKINTLTFSTLKSISVWKILLHYPLNTGTITLLV